MQKKLDMDVKADHLVDMDPSYFEKVAVQNMFTQEILVDFMKFPKDLKEVGGQHKEYRELLDLVNNAANWYTKDELKR